MDLNLLMDSQGRALVFSFAVPFLVFPIVLLVKPDARGAWWVSVVGIWICVTANAFVWLGRGSHPARWLYDLVDYTLFLGWAPACIWCYLLLTVRRLITRRVRSKGGSV